MFDSLINNVVDYITKIPAILLKLLIVVLKLIYDLIYFFMDFAIFNDNVEGLYTKVLIYSMLFMSLIVLLVYTYGFFQKDFNPLKPLKNIILVGVLIVVFPTIIISLNNITGALLEQFLPDSNEFVVDITNSFVHDKTNEEVVFENYDDIMTFFDDNLYVQRAENDITTDTGTLAKDERVYEVDYLFGIIGMLTLCVIMLIFNYKIAMSFLRLIVYYVMSSVTLVIGVADGLKMYGNMLVNLVREYGQIIFYGILLSLYGIFFNFYQTALDQNNTYTGYEKNDFTVFNSNNSNIFLT